MRKIILASKSPRREKLLKQIGLQFEIIPSGVKEVIDSKLDHSKQVEKLSFQKAEVVAKQFSDAIIIGADSMIAIGDEIIGKPKDKKDAVRILKKLSGKMHLGITGFTIIDTKSGKKLTRSVTTRVWFKKLNEREIESYLSRDEPYDFAGAYSVASFAAVLVEKIEGDFYNVVGLPLFVFSEELKQFGINLL